MGRSRKKFGSIGKKYFLRMKKELKKNFSSRWRFSDSLETFWSSSLSRSLDMCLSHSHLSLSLAVSFSHFLSLLSLSHTLALSLLLSFSVAILICLFHSLALSFSFSCSQRLTVTHNTHNTLTLINVLLIQLT